MHQAETVQHVGYDGRVEQAAKVIDILEALKRSLELAKKPPVSEVTSIADAAPRKRAPRKAAGG